MQSLNISLKEDFYEQAIAEENEQEEKEEEANLKEQRIDYSQPLPIPNKTVSEQNKELYDLMAKRAKMVGAMSSASCVEETLIPGKLAGTWRELGGYQYGSIVNVDYDRASNKIYMISSGGHIWRGNLDGSGYEILNQQFRLETLNDVFSIVPHNGGLRILGIPKFTDRTLHYSDDYGITWTPCQNINLAGGYKEPISLRKTRDNKLYYHVFSANGSTEYNDVFYSDNGGVSFTKIISETENNDPAVKFFIDVWVPLNSDKVYVLDNYHARLHEVINGNITKTTTYGGIPKKDKQRLVGFINGAGQPIFYLLNTNEKIYKSTDGGNNWFFFADNPNGGLFNYWRSLSVDPAIEDQIYYGSAETYIYEIPTKTWRKITTSYENGKLYPDISGKVHWDSESLKVFQKNDGSFFSLYAGHGGLEVSYDQWSNSTFLGRNQLAISTFYATATMADGTFYGVCQDRAAHYTRNGLADNCTIDPMVSLVYSGGDQTDVLLTENGTVLWRFGIGGTVTIDFDGMSNKFNENTRNRCEVNFRALFPKLPGGIEQSYRGWEPAKYINHNPELDYIWYGGGDLNGSDGAHLIKTRPDKSKVIKVDADGGTVYDVHLEQYPYNFRANSFSSNKWNNIYIIGKSGVDPNRMYVGMKDGSFFYSNDAGNSWTRSTEQLATNNYALALSKKNKDIVYVAGDQDANVYRSTDGGISFTKVNNSSPNRPKGLIFDMEWNPEETLLFVGSSTGAYAYEPATDQWYNIMGQSAPMADYKDVDYIPEINSMRWSVWGRGAFDLKLSNTPIVNCAVTGTITANAPEVCGGPGSFPSGFFNLSGHEGEVKQWEWSLDNSNWNVSVVGNLTANTPIEVGGPNTFHVRALVQKDNCAALYTPVKTVQVNACDGTGSNTGNNCTVTGTITANAPEVCGGPGSFPSGFFNLSGHEGEVKQWEWSLDNSNWIVSVVGNLTANTPIEVGGPNTFHVRALVQKDNCTALYTPVKTVQVNACDGTGGNTGNNCTVTGTITANAPEVCGGPGNFPSGFFNLSGHEGEVKQWEWSLDNSNWIVSVVGNLTANTPIEVGGPNTFHVRALVQKDNCTALYTPVKTVQVNACDGTGGNTGNNCTVTGTITANAPEVCGGPGNFPSGFFNLSGHEGEVKQWEWSLDNSNWITLVVGNFTSNTPVEMGGPNTFHVRALVQKDNCTALYTPVKTVQVNACDGTGGNTGNNCTVTGTITANATEVCGGPGNFPSGFFNLSGHQGEVKQWEWSLDNSNWITLVVGNFTSNTPD